MDVGFLTAAQAEAQLRERLPDLGAGELTIVVDGVPSSVPLSRAGRDHDYAALVQAAMAVGRSGNAWVDGQERLATLVLGTQVADSATVDPARLDRLVVETATRTFVAPTEAAVVTNPDGTYAVTAPAAGRRIPPEAIRSALVAALVGPATDAPVADLTSEPVPFTVTQAQAAEAAAAARAMFAAPLTLTDGGDTYAVASADIQAAIGFGTRADGEYGVLLDRIALTGAVSALADGIRRQPTDAAFIFNATGPSAVQPAVRGRTLDVDGTVTAIVAGLERRGRGIEIPAVALSASFVEPTLTSAAAAEILPNLVRLSTWTTLLRPRRGERLRRQHLASRHRTSTGWSSCPGRTSTSGATSVRSPSSGATRTAARSSVGGAPATRRSAAGSARRPPPCSTPRCEPDSRWTRG